VHPPDEPALDALWVHERVVERLMADRAVLPMRFGSKTPDEEALRDVLAERQDSLIAALDLVRGRVEVAVRAIRQDDSAATLHSDRAGAPEPAITTGHDYLLSKLQDGRRAEQAAATIHEPLAALAVLSRRQRPRTGEEVLRAAYLVDRGALPRFRSSVERLQRANAGTAILCTGPWPPYSFVDGTALRIKEPAT
jgi:hypothetical protein